MGRGVWILHAPIVMMLLAATTPSESCTCFFHHPQAYFCRLAIVIKGQFLNATKVILPSNPNYPVAGYTIKAEEVFKGNISQDPFFVFNLAPSPCEYKHNPDNFHKDYVITARGGESLYYMSSCYFNKPWSELPSSQIKGLQGAYAKECGCEVTPCFQPPCNTTEKQCAFVQYDESVRLDQEQNQICAQNDQGNCIWKTIV